MNTEKIENLEAIGLITIIMLNKIILNYPKSVIIKTKTASWINVLYISLLAVIITILISKLLKNFPNSDIIDISNFLGKRKLSTIIGIIHIIFMLITISLVLRNFSESLKLIYYPNSPIIYLLLFFLIVAFIGNIFGIKSISKATLLISPVIILSIFIILFSSIKNFTPQRLFPILGYGAYETFLSGTTNLFGFTGIAYLLFLKPLLKNEENFSKISIISITISGIYLILSVVCLLASFSFIINTNENISIYLLTRMTKYGDFIQRSNAIFIFIWIISVCSYLCITLFFIIYLTKKITQIKDTLSLNLCYCSIILGLSLLLENYAKHLQIFETFFRYTILIYVYVINVLILILASIKYKLKLSTKERIKQ